MAPRVEPVTPNETVPERAEVVVIGGGIAGVSTAFFLAERGIPVVLCEKGHIAGEQSSRNWGWVRKQGRDPRELPLIIESLRLWQQMNALTETETGFRQTGILYLAKTEAEVAGHEAWLEHARPYQLDSKLVRGEALERLLPNGRIHWAGALYTASDGRAEPQIAAPAIARAAQARGATILTHCAVRGLEREGGRVSAVVTEKGRIACGSVVLAGGAWSSLFCRQLGIRLPQLKVLASVQRTAPLEGAPETAAWGPGFTFRRRLDGGYTVAQGTISDCHIVPDSFRYFGDFLPALKTSWRDLRFRLGKRFVEEWGWNRRWSLDQVSPFERVRVLDPEPSAGLLDQAMANLRQAYPAFDKAVVAERWGGLIDTTPDVVPVISPVETLPGFFIATGFSGHGFGIGPAAGKLMADLVTGAAPLVDPTPFRYSRMIDGTRHQPMAGL